MASILVPTADTKRTERSEGGRETPERESEKRKRQTARYTHISMLDNLTQQPEGEKMPHHERLKKAREKEKNKLNFFVRHPWQHTIPS